MALKDRLTSKFAIKAYIVLASLTIFVFLADAFIMPAIIHSRVEIAIPNVINKPLAVAQNILLDRGLTPIVSSEAPDAKIPLGHVVFQNPAAQSVVREGRNVYLVVSGGEQLVAMPNLRGRSLRDAKITLEQLELRLGLVTDEASDLPPETVIAQGIPVGKRIPAHTSVQVSVSSGVEIQQKEVPYIIGMSLSEAQNKLLDAGLNVGKITYRESKNLLPNTIVNQSPLAGDIVSANTPIDITIVH